MQISFKYSGLLYYKVWFLLGLEIAEGQEHKMQYTFRLEPYSLHNNGNKVD